MITLIIGFALGVVTSFGTVGLLIALDEPDFVLEEMDTKK